MCIHAYTLWGSRWCPFCQRLKSVLGELGVAADVLELEDANKQPLVKDEASLSCVSRFFWFV